MSIRTNRLAKTRPRRQPLQARRSREVERPLSPARAFVVQFREGAPGPRKGFTGRVEHMVTGHTARFESPAELLAFFDRVLRAVPATLAEER